ncbi:MAG: HypC/HybG/HupF family hydrogenase formation chaperone [Dehalococcoidales bacterium]|jgi:hydrogenase expression/formation protein HypC|nr:HypC/HybG/HupF family hydrogenase formation chaperone [Dehalococcoidales bacterium]NLT27935.1 HypC/HybG/HupF family hydrogenase formation chaperone [Dehalococcoidales bacterium]
MCVAVPSLITAVDGTEAEVDIGGISRKASLMLTPDAKIGDYVLIHAGYAISIVDREEAEATLELFRELAEGIEPEELNS